MQISKGWIKSDLLRTKQFVHSWYEPAEYHREIAGALQDANIKRLIITLPPQHGKQLANNTPVLTVNGWVNHGELTVGEYVFGLDGKPKKILAENNETKCTHTIKFTDGSEFDSHYNHIWILENKAGEKQQYSIADLLKVPLKNTERYLFYLPKHEIIKFDKKPQSVNPFLLGFWLGDGKSKDGVICKPKKQLDAVCAKLKSFGYNIGDYWSMHNYDLSYCTIYGLITKLKELNLYNNKHIPSDYLFCGEKQRLELLAGLIDSDGAVFYDNRTEGKARVRVTFINTNYNLIEGVKFICDTFGWRTYISKQAPTKSTSGIVGKKVCFQICFTPDLPIPTVLYDLSSDKINKKLRRIALSEIKRCCNNSVGKCIQVENDIYLAGWNLIPTHNSEILCKTFPAWYLGHNPEQTIIVSSYSDEYSNKLSVQCADFFGDSKFQSLFNLQPHPDNWAKHERMLKGHKGSIIFVGAGGGITGNPADILLLDDLTKNYEDASSKIKQESLWNWYNTVIKTRLQGDESRIIIIMTRWLKNDLIGKIQNQEIEKETPVIDRFKIIHYPAILDIKNNDIKTGRSLWPEKKSMKFLLGQYEDSPTTFMTMYQGNPKDLEGNIINSEWIKFENDIKALGKRRYSCRGWDFGYSETGDYTVGSKVDVYEMGEMIIPILADVVRFREKPSKSKEIIVSTILNDGPDTIVALESGGTQIAMADDIINRKELFNFSIRTYKPKGDKVARAMPWVLKLEDGIFKFSRGKWNKFAIDEMSEFSDNCDHDDIEDSITTAWKILFGGAQ